MKEGWGSDNTHTHTHTLTVDSFLYNTHYTTCNII